jgi:hypothetical protein
MARSTRLAGNALAAILCEAHPMSRPVQERSSLGLRMLAVYSGRMRWLGAHRGHALGKQHVARLARGLAKQSERTPTDTDNTMRNEQSPRARVEQETISRA